MTRSARRAKRPSSAWMVDCGGLSTQPLWRPCSVAWIVASSGAPARRASRSAAPPTSQSWPWTTSNASSSTRAAPARSMCAFMLRTQETNRFRSSGYSGSGTRWTCTPWRSSWGAVRAPPRVSTWTSTPSRTSASESLRTWRASPPSTIGGYSQLRTRAVGANAWTLPAQLQREQRDGDGRGGGQLVGDPEEQVEQRGQQEHERGGGELPAMLGREHAAEDARDEEVAVAERGVGDAGELQLGQAGGRRRGDERGVR